MPSLKSHQSGSTTKLLFIGDSGSGKTGALASLAAAGYNLRILDLDNGLDVLTALLQDGVSYPKEAADRVKFETITDKMKHVAGRLIPGQAGAWKKTIDMLSYWKTKDGGEVEDLGPITSWTQKDILVIDSLTMVSKAAMNYVLALNARLGAQPQQQDWYQAQQLIESLMEMLYDDHVKCNVIINCHITYVGGEGQPLRGYPNTLGRALPPKLGRYFNSILLARTVGSKRQILTQSDGVIELKNTNPIRVPRSLPLASGLADYFKFVREFGPIEQELSLGDSAGAADDKAQG